MTQIRLLGADFQRLSRYLLTRSKSSTGWQCSSAQCLWLAWGKTGLTGIAYAIIVKGDCNGYEYARGIILDW